MLKPSYLMTHYKILSANVASRDRASLEDSCLSDVAVYYLETYEQFCLGVLV